ncbi:MAG: radical SAM protein, partial [Candidatus Tectomicrobia bacterium]|nr:radical SAM protein [Candidatus Tectomicrobia bacterium]
MVEIDTVLIKPVSRCNLNCRYCYVYHMGDANWTRLPKLMSSETMSATVKALTLLAQAQLRRFAVVLHGGEPLMLGSDRLAYLLAALRNALPAEYPFSIQTNGTLITDDILDICAQYHTSLGVSIDGPLPIHNRHRIDHQSEGTYERVLEGILKLSNHPGAQFLYAGLLAVIDPTSDPYEVYHFFKSI